MKYSILLLSLFFILILLTACHNKSYLKTSFPNIHSQDEELQILFQFYYEKDFAPLPIHSINVMNEDTILLRLESNKYVTEYNFPTLPDEFDLVYPESKEEVGPFLKNEHLYFSFMPDENAYERIYEHFSFYSDPESRWRFNEKGELDSKIFAFYKSWVGDDVINIKFNSDVMVDDNSFKVEYSDHLFVPYEIRKERNPTDRVILKLERDAIDKTIITLHVSAKLIDPSENDTKYLKYKIFYNDAGVIGLLGKDSFIK